MVVYTSVQSALSICCYHKTFWGPRFCIEETWMYRLISVFTGQRIKKTDFLITQHMVKGRNSPDISLFVCEYVECLVLFLIAVCTSTVMESKTETTVQLPNDEENSEEGKDSVPLEDTEEKWKIVRIRTSADVSDLKVGPLWLTGLKCMNTLEHLVCVGWKVALANAGQRCTLKWAITPHLEPLSVRKYRPPVSHQNLVQLSSTLKIYTIAAL